MMLSKCVSIGGAMAAQQSSRITMSDLAKNTKATLIPVLRHRDAPAAIEWLCQAFGFDRH